MQIINSKMKLKLKKHIQMIIQNYNNKIMKRKSSKKMKIISKFFKKI